MRYCIAHNPLLLQPLGHWFTFISRKCEHLAVGSSDIGLTDSRGSLPLGLPCPLLLYPYCITTWVVCQEGISNFFEIFYRRRTKPCSMATHGIHFHVAPLTLQIIAHPIAEYNRQNTQNREKIFLNICATFLLTKLARHGIMEISARAHVGGPTKPPPFSQPKLKGGGNSFQFLISIFGVGTPATSIS